MQSQFVRRFIVPLGAATIVLASACGPSDMVGEKQLKNVKPGMTMAQVDQVIGQGSLEPIQPSDNLRLHNGHRTQAFMVNGERYTVLWYRDTPGLIDAPITRETQTPILFQGDTVIARGWARFDAKARELGIPNPYRERARLDSIADAAPRS